MKKLAAVIALALLVAAGIWIFARIQLANRLAAVPELLPNTTLVLLELPNLTRTRERWHESDLNRIWREPAVRTWLQKPLTKFPRKNTGNDGLEEFLALGPTNLFVALTAVEQNEPKFAGGFHFTATANQTRAFVDSRTASWWPKAKEIKRESVAYRQHQIEFVSWSRFVFASASYDNWFLAANDLAVLKALLDRASHQDDKGAVSLQDDKVFAAAQKHLPSDFAGMVFLNPQPFVEKLLPLMRMTGQSIPPRQLEMLKSIQSVTGAIGFDHGKMRETDFVAMPRMGKGKKLERRLLAVAGADTFFYSASQMQWPNEIISPASMISGGFSALLNQLDAGFKAHGVTTDDLPKAFDDQFEVICNWPADARFPFLAATVPVKDPERARKIAEALTSLPIAGAEWTREDKNGAMVFSVQPFGSQLPLNPTLVLSPDAVYLGNDSANIDSLRARLAKPDRELEKSARFREAVARIRLGDCAFNYVDTQLLWERLDATLRPLLAVSATFYPALGKGVDLAKIPSPDVITKHLSPIVMSQRFEKEGYITESVGPITFRTATLGIGAAIGGSLIYLREGLKSSGFNPVGNLPAGGTTPTPVPATPSASIGAASTPGSTPTPP